MKKIETKLRCVRLDDFIDYIEKNYRKCALNGKDYELIEIIANNYSAKEIKLALDYCQKQKTDSLVYLQKALTNKYYLDEKNIVIPEWDEENLKAKPLDEEDKKWARNFYKQFCDSEKEYQKRLKETGLEN